jgi:hypothetical protein
MWVCDNVLESIKKPKSNEFGLFFSFLWISYLIKRLIELLSVGLSQANILLYFWCDSLLIYVIINEIGLKYSNSLSEFSHLPTHTLIFCFMNEKEKIIMCAQLRWTQFRFFDSSRTCVRSDILEYLETSIVREKYSYYIEFDLIDHYANAFPTLKNIMDFFTLCFS